MRPLTARARALDRARDMTGAGTPVRARRGTWEETARAQARRGR
jgi:hypothetical protein